MLYTNILKKNFEFILSFILGTTLILLLIYFRIIYKRLPKQLNFWFILEGNVLSINYQSITIILVFLFLSITMLYLSLKFIYKLPVKDNKFLGALRAIYTIITNSMFTVYHYFSSKFDDPFDFIGIYIMKFYFLTVARQKYILFFEYSIRCIILITLSIDVFIFFTLNFFYTFLPLLGLNLLLQFWFFILKDWSNNKDSLEEMLIITKELVGTTKEKYKYRFTPKYNEQSLDLLYHVTQYRNCLTIKEYLTKFELLRDFYNPRFNLFYYLVLLLSVFYVLIYNYLMFFSAFTIPTFNPWL